MREQSTGIFETVATKSAASLLAGTLAVVGLAGCAQNPSALEQRRLSEAQQQAYLEKSAACLHDKDVTDAVEPKAFPNGDGKTVYSLDYVRDGKTNNIVVLARAAVTSKSRTDAIAEGLVVGWNANTSASILGSHPNVLIVQKSNDSTEKIIAGMC